MIVQLPYVMEIVRYFLLHHPLSYTTFQRKMRIRSGQVKLSIDDNSDDVFCTESPEVNTPEEIQETSFEIKNNISTIRTNNSDSNLEKMHLRVNHLWDQKLHLELGEHANTNSEIGKMKKKTLTIIKF